MFGGEGAQSLPANFHIPARPRLGVNWGEQPAPGWPASWKGREGGREGGTKQSFQSCGPGGCQGPPLPLPSWLPRPCQAAHLPAACRGTSSSFSAQPLAAGHRFAASSTATDFVTSGKLLNFSVPALPR